MQTVIEKLQERKQQILVGNHEKLGPGVPQRMSPAMSEGEAVAQGDVYFEVGTGIPAGYVKVKNPVEKNRSLAWDTGSIGSNHKLDSLVGVDIYLPPNGGRTR